MVPRSSIPKPALSAGKRSRLFFCYRFYLLVCSVEDGMGLYLACDSMEKAQEVPEFFFFQFFSGLNICKGDKFGC